MPIAKLFINNVERDLLKANVPREACRALDQGKFELPATTNVCPSDEITYVQDMVCLGTNRLLFNFEFHPKDESGYTHHIIGHCTYPSPISHWCFQNVLTDDGLCANDLTVMCGCATFTCGKTTNTCGVARSFDFACGRYLVAPNECDYDLTTGQKMTFAMWIYPGAGCGAEFVFGKRAGLAACNTGYSIEHNKTCNNATFTLGNGTTEFTVASAMCTVPACMWTHIGVTYDGQLNTNAMKIYINSELNTTGACLTITGAITNNCVISIGADSGGTNDYTGRADDVRIFADKELSLCQMASLYHDGAISYEVGKWDGKAIRFDGDKGHGIVPDAAPADPRPLCLVTQLKFECNLTDSAGCNTGTMGRGSETYVGGLIDDKAFDFDGCVCGRYIDLANEGNFDFERTDKFSTSSWFNTSATCMLKNIISKRAGSNNFWMVRMGMCGEIQFDLRSTGCDRARITTTCQTLQDCNWHHLVTTYDGSSDALGLHIYIDGKEATHTVNNNCLTSTILNDAPVRIGAQNTGGTNPWIGQIDCVRIWKTELTPKEVKRLYQSTYSPHNGKYEYITWIKIACPSACGSRTIFHKSLNATEGVELEVQDNILNQGFTPTGFSASGFTSASASVCSVTWRHGACTLTSTSDIVDNTFHQVRVTRDDCNLVSLFIDNVKEACQTITCDPTSTANLEFGRDACAAQQFCGDISSFRFYHGNLDDIETCRLATVRNPRSNVKFGGNSTKITKSISKKKLVTQSFSKQLGEIEVRATTFNCRTPEFILETLLKCNTNLDTHFHGAPAGITLQVYQADGKLVDIANDLTQLAGKVYHVDGVKQFHLHDDTFNLTTASFTHGLTVANIDSASDDAEIVNELLIIGANKRYTTSEFFTGDCTKTVFCLQQGPVTARVEHPILTELCPEVDYEVCSVNKTLTFTCAPDMCGCANNILIEYEYELPLNIKGTNPASIAAFGTKAKRLVLPWIKNRQDGVRFINAYLNNFRDIKARYEVSIPGLANGIDVHDVITIINPIKNVNGTFIIKSITWDYPRGTTLLHVGEFNFHSLEFARQITEKIHDLESAVTTSKDLRDFESPQEVLVITDTVGVNVNIQAPSESTGIAASVCVTETFDATYDCSCSTYDGDDAYV